MQVREFAVLPHQHSQPNLFFAFRARRFSANVACVQRESLKDATRIVVKVGTGVLTNNANQPDLAQMEQLVAQVAHQRCAGKEIVLVTSGAIGSGMGLLGHTRRPTELAELQACAAVGQLQLMSVYQQLFAKLGIRIAQVLLTHEDLEHHERHLNARNTLITLLEHGVVPIVNENDTVSFAEIKFGDNDKLSALVAALLPADLLVILTSVDGVIENFGQPNARLVTLIERIDQHIKNVAKGTTSPTSVGGMVSKIEAAQIVTRSGIPLVIASGRKKDVLECILAGEQEGTLFVPNPRKLKGRKRWIAFFHHPKGTIYVDDGAKVALRECGKSLLLPGIIRCEGDFNAGEVIRICDANGTEFARGIARFSGNEIRTGKLSRVEVVHRDDMVIL